MYVNQIVSFLFRLKNYHVEATVRWKCAPRKFGWTDLESLLVIAKGGIDQEQNLWFVPRKLIPISPLHTAPRWPRSVESVSLQTTYNL